MRFQDPFKSPLQTMRAWQNPYSQMLASSAQTVDPLPIHFGEDLRARAGRWRDLFAQNPEHLVLEIGTHLGKTFIALALDQPDWGILGMDITFKRVVKTGKKVQAHGLRNARCLLLDARFVAEIFAPQELSGVLVFFPDPWTKKSQSKHRLLNEKSVAAIFSSIKTDGFFWLKTDCLDYFTQVETIAAQLGAKKIDLQQSLFKQDYSSTFQQHCLKDNLPVYSQLFEIKR